VKTLLSPLACLSKTQGRISDLSNLPINERVSVSAPKHLAPRVSCVEPVLRIESCPSAFTLRIVIL